MEQQQNNQIHEQTITENNIMPQITLDMVSDFIQDQTVKDLGEFLKKKRNSPNEDLSKKKAPHHHKKIKKSKTKKKIKNKK